MAITLYYWPGYCSLAGHIVLEWIGADYVLVRADQSFRGSDEYAPINPSRTVPAVLFEDGFALSQNVAILNYLAELYPEARLQGDGSARARARVNRWLSYIAADVHKTFSPLLHPDRILGDELTKEATLARARDQLRAHFTVFEQALGGRDWLVENQRSIADPYLYVLLRWARAARVELSGCVHLDRYYNRFRDDEVIRRILTQEGDTPDPAPL